VAQRRNFWRSGSSGVINTATNVLVPGATGTAWTLSTGGSQVTDMQYINASGVSTGAVPAGVLTADSSGFVPSIKGPPDDTGLLWVDFGFGRFALIAHDPVMYAIPANGHAVTILPDVSVSPTKYDLFSAAGSLISTFKVADYSSGLCAPAAVQAAVIACGTGSVPTPTGGAYVDRHTVGLGDGDYPVVEAAGQLYCILVAGVSGGYWCRGIMPLSSNFATIDRNLPTDELVAGPVFRYIGGSGTAGTGTAADPQSTTTKRVLQVGVLASGSRKVDNPHAFTLGPVGFVSTSAATQFDFVVAYDTNDVELWGTQFAGNYGAGNGCFRPHGTLTPDDGPVAWKVHKLFARDIYRAIVSGNDSVGATDGEVNNSRFLAHRDYAMKFGGSGGTLIQGGHYTCSGTLGGGHLYTVGGGPTVIYGGYWDTCNTSGAHMRFGGGGWCVRGAHFKTNGQTQVIDATNANAWKSPISGINIDNNGSTALQFAVRYANAVKNNRLTTQAAYGTAAGNCSVQVSAASVVFALGSWVRFSNGVHARVTTATTSPGTANTTFNLPLTAVPVTVPSGATGTATPVQLNDATLDGASGNTAWLGFAGTVDNTVLDFLAEHSINPATLRVYT
jgi:hypothetical protein